MLFSSASSSFGLCLSSLLLSSLVSALPPSTGPLRLPTRPLKPISRATANLVKTPLGSIQGVAASTGGGSRYTVRYASASKRWDESAVVSSWSTTFDGTAMPPSCPQDVGYSSGSTFSEDCLYQVVYSPKNAANLPVMVWIHGGSFVAGSASAPGLDGAIFAEKNHVVVVVLQYRLGVLGLLPPSNFGLKTNLAVRDVVNALKFLQTTLPSFGGDPKKVTVAGHSSGAQMVRALLSSSVTKDLFRTSILQSDPMNYGMSSPATTSILTSAFYSAVSGYASTLDDLRNLDIDTLLAIQSPFVAGAFTLDSSIPLASAIRPTTGDELIPLDFAQALSQDKLPVSSVWKPMLLTTTKDELGTTVGGLAPEPITAEDYAYFISLFAPDEAKASAILASRNYTIGSGTDAARSTLLKLGTESIWTCAVRGVAELWTKRGGLVYVGEFEQGMSYGLNPYIPFCSQKVCHEDDIYLTFGTKTSTRAVTETMARWGNFVTNIDPQYSNFKYWDYYTGEASTLTIGVRIGGTGVYRSCPANFWGVSPTLFDWQAYS